MLNREQQQSWDKLKTLFEENNLGRIYTNLKHVYCGPFGNNRYFQILVPIKTENEKQTLDIRDITFDVWVVLPGYMHKHGGIGGRWANPDEICMELSRVLYGESSRLTKWEL